MKSKNYKAIVFDLFGTLVTTFSSRAHDIVLFNMAKALGVPDGAFAKLFDYDMRTAREIGDFPTIEENIEAACNQLGENPTATAIGEAAGYRFDFMRNALVPRNDALETIDQIRLKGYVIGLISDCSPEVPIMWSKTPFAKIIDVPIFSCEVGIKKPDQRIYNLLCDQLGVKPNECLYVGDGDSSELEGASVAGMDPVLFRAKGEDEHDRDRPLVDSWKGKKVSQLSDVLRLV
jgi:putative hydrolase of the HAD superfamily